MSVQTGVETPSGPASERIGDRLRYRFTVMRSEPNPIWLREMRQAARLVRTPIILMVLTVLMTLLMASIGGLITGDSSPAEAGSVLFHTYFSLAFFVVALVGPALAANSIASEREGKTWEAVLLTGMSPDAVARGKFFAAYTAIAMYIVMLAPAGAIPFLFGGVTPVEVLVAFVFLFLMALLSVAFGLAVSAKMASLRGALLVTLLVATPLACLAFGLLGYGLSDLVHRLWSAVEREMPVWLPTAFGRAPFGLRYVVYLILLPLGGILLPAWLLYEITRANITSITDDRSYGLKRWFIVASICCTLAATVPMFEVRVTKAGYGLVLGMCCLFVFVIFNGFLFVGEPIGPSRRVRAMLEDAGPFRRMLRPSIMRATTLQLVPTMFAFTALALTGAIYLTGTSRADDQILVIILFSAYAVGFGCFFIGLSALLRVRTRNVATARVLLLVALFVLSSGPWILAAIGGAISDTRMDDDYLIAAPSPFYVFVAIDNVTGYAGTDSHGASLFASLAYAIVGIVLMLLANQRAGGILGQYHAILAEAERRLDEEDALLNPDPDLAVDADDEPEGSPQH